MIGMPQIINAAGDYASAAVGVSKAGHPIMPNAFSSIW